MNISHYFECKDINFRIKALINKHYKLIPKPNQTKVLGHNLPKNCGSEM